MQKEIVDLSLKLDGRSFAGENTIFSKYSVPYFQIPLLYFATTACVALKTEKHRNKINSETGLKIMTPREIQ